MSEVATAKCSCMHCAVHLEFPVTAQGTEIDCPRCGQKTTLDIPATDYRASAEATLSMEQVLSAFTGAISHRRVSLPYLVGLLLVTCAMLLLPALYLGLAALAGWLTCEWALHARDILPNTYAGLYGYLIILTLYVAPLFAGTVLVLFMIKPLFARRPRQAQPLALNPGAEPLLFAFVCQIAQCVGAPLPRRIDVDCQLNAAAGFRRGFWSLLGNDLVLKLGLPLVEGLNARQLAEVVAHELGHFSQGMGMRLSFLVRSINAWFQRVVYQRDAWDVLLDEWAETESLLLGIIVGCARAAVWASRRLLRLVMLGGHAVSCYMSRQMEYHADSCAIQLAGSDTFEADTFRIAALSCARQNAYRQMEDTWRRQRALPVDFAAYLMAFDKAMPPELRQQIEDTLGLAATGPFDTHPSPGDRIRRARQAAAPGFVQLEAPATALFSDFRILSGQVSLLHYADDLGLPVGQARFYSLADEPQT